MRCDAFPGTRTVRGVTCLRFCSFHHHQRPDFLILDTLATLCSTIKKLPLPTVIRCHKLTTQLINCASIIDNIYALVPSINCTPSAASRRLVHPANQSLRVRAIDAMPEEEFDSGDDLFDDVVVDDLLQKNSGKRPGESGNLSTSSKKPRLTLNQSADDNVHKTLVDEGARLQVARKILKQKFGYQSFRHEQEGAISRILGGENAVVIFPTGAGKSLCYQVRSWRNPTASSSQSAYPPKSAADSRYCIRGTGSRKWFQADRRLGNYNCSFSSYCSNEGSGRCVKEKRNRR